MLDRMARVLEPFRRFPWWGLAGVGPGAGPGRHRVSGASGVSGARLGPSAPPPVVPLPHGAMVRRSAAPGSGCPAACVCVAAPPRGTAPRRRVLWVVEDGFGLRPWPGHGPRPLRAEEVAR